MKKDETGPYFSSTASNRDAPSRMFAPTLAALLGAVLFINSVVMLYAPFDWYRAVPGVMETGAFNQHFVRDIALLYALIGGAFVTGARKPQLRVFLWGIPSLWLTGHAFFHFWEIAAGICGPGVIPRDFPAVTFPALLGLGLTAWAWRNQAQRHTTIVVR